MRRMCRLLIFSKAASRGRSNLSGSGRYVSPLDQSRPGPSGYRKRAASPACGSFSKCGRRGRGMTPPSGKGKGFRSRSHVPVQLQSAVVCHSTGRCGATRARILG